jgi:predicted RNase H-like nuclease
MVSSVGDFLEMGLERKYSAGATSRAAVTCWTAGVDGCRGGWVVLLAGFRASEAAPVQLDWRVCARFDSVLALEERPAAIAVDMPIGLLERAAPGGRACDRAARGLLRWPRASSVFSPPARPALVNDGYVDAMARNGGGMSKEAYNILPKIRELDALLAPQAQSRVFEAHPELAFAALAGHPMRHNKKTSAGRRERLRCLRTVFGAAFRDPLRVRLELGTRAVALDDVIDAYVLADAARRIQTGRASRLPPGAPPLDARGLRMEIWY